MKFQLVIQNDITGPDYGADSCVIDLEASDMKSARKEALILLRGNPSKWTAEWVTTYDGEDRIQVELDEDQDTFWPYKHKPLLATNREGDNWVRKATLVQVVEKIPISKLRAEIDNAFE